jgi:tetratricopeptide (TPR) repeat protein
MAILMARGSKRPGFQQRSAAIAGLALIASLGIFLSGCSAQPELAPGAEASDASAVSGEARDRAAAEALYAAGDVEAAASAFRWLSEASPADADLHYNLGSACLALHQGAGDLGCALLAYERAALLAPRDAGIAQALAEAQARAGRQASSEGSRFVASADWDWLAGLVSMDELLLALLIAWNLLALTWLGIRRRRSEGPAGQLLWRSATGLLLLLLILSAGRWMDASARPRAILTAAESQSGTAGPGPAGEARPTVLVAPGSSLRILERQDGYLRVQLAGQDERIWLPSAAVTELGLR